MADNPPKNGATGPSGDEEGEGEDEDFEDMDY
jgi:hypothetical protein